MKSGNLEETETGDIQEDGHWVCNDYNPETCKKQCRISDDLGETSFSGDCQAGQWRNITWKETIKNDSKIKQ